MEGDPGRGARLPPLASQVRLRQRERPASSRSREGEHKSLHGLRAQLPTALQVVKGNGTHRDKKGLPRIQYRPDAAGNSNVNISQLGIFVTVGWGGKLVGGEKSQNWG